MRVGLRTCRDLAWTFAGRLAYGDDPPAINARRDADTAWVARAMLRPWSPVNLAARMVARVESRDIPQIVAALNRSEIDLDIASRAAETEVVAMTDQSAGPNLSQAAHHRRVRRHPRR